ncbi:MAG: 4-alpha-glucanotransferase [Gemmatimonadota bacterium]|nr:4-alpha-glucanotransferase [Gemmatimonadota bacterium]
MRLPRAGGVLLHPTSLPGPCGIGDLGLDSYRFLDLLQYTGMRYWQMLPIGPTGYGDSPYQCFSAFAGNPLLVHVGESDATFPAHTVDFGRVIPTKQAMLREYTRAMPDDAAARAFYEAEAWWLDDFALFMALKTAHGGVAWTDWEPALAQRQPEALAAARARLADDIEHHRRVQHLFFLQFRALKGEANRRGIQLIGDLPIYVAHDSADVWANPEQFRLRSDGRPAVQAGVPPDYFSATGQRWGNPIYAWDRMEADGFRWWIRRMRAMFANFDVVRIDHFRGFESFWEVPGDDTTAVNGRWVKAPGDALFDAITDALGPVPIIAENLGVITPAVEALRERYAYPGMSILQFAFSTDGSANDFQPHTYPRERVVYTGTHDNDTMVGWWASTGGGDSTRTPEEVQREKAFAMRYLGWDGTDVHWRFIREALASVADTALFPMQDLLGLGSEARMNRPGRPEGNWQFRFSWDQVTPAIADRLRELVHLYQR